MADYINKNILCQAYIHVEIEELEGAEIKEIESHLVQFLKSRSQFFLYQDVDVSLEVKEGSYKLYLTVLGTVSALYHGIAVYKDFRESVPLLYDDAKRLAEYVVSESLYSTKSKHDQIIRVEARTGVIGSLKKIVGNLNSLSDEFKFLEAKDSNRRLKELKEDVSDLTSNIKSADDLNLVCSELGGMVDRLPLTPANPKKRNAPEEISEYKSLLKSIKLSLQESQNKGA